MAAANLQRRGSRNVYDPTSFSWALRGGQYIPDDAAVNWGVLSPLGQHASAVSMSAYRSVRMVFTSVSKHAEFCIKSRQYQMALTPNIVGAPQ